MFNTWKCFGCVLTCVVGFVIAGNVLFLIMVFGCIFIFLIFPIYCFLPFIFIYSLDLFLFFIWLKDKQTEHHHHQNIIIACFCVCVCVCVLRMPKLIHI